MSSQIKYNLSIEQIKHKYYKENKSQAQIAKELEVSQWVISHRMRTAELEIKSKTRNFTNRKYTVNHDYFDRITEESAWILGWLISDGFAQKNYFGIKVSEKDADIIYKIKEMLDYTGVVYSYENKLTQTNKTYRQKHLKITSNKIVNRLKDFEIYPNKSLTVKFPRIILNTGSEDIIRNFIKGVFEGDGSILLDKNTSLLFQIVGTKELLQEIQTCLIKYLNVNRNKLTRNVLISNHYALRYRGRYQALKIFDWLYCSSQFHLDRKFKKYLEIKSKLII